jgi:transcription initiation factor IIE alpha subunit
VGTTTFGPAFSEKLDGERIRGQLCKLLAFMSDEQWRTLAEISERTGIPQASASSDLRHLRKERFGSYRVEKRRRSAGTWEYAVFSPDPGSEQKSLF